MNLSNKKTSTGSRQKFLDTPLEKEKAHRIKIKLFLAKSNGVFLKKNAFNVNVMWQM